MSKEIAKQVTVPPSGAQTSTQSLVVMATSPDFVGLFDHIDRIEYQGKDENGFVWNVYGKGNDAE